MLDKSSVKSGVDDTARTSVYHAISQIIANRKTLIISVGFTLILAILYLRLANYTYTAQIMIIPVQSSSSSLGKQLSGLAAVAGMSLSAESKVAPFDVYMEEINSRTVADQLSSTRKDLMTRIFAAEWDASRGQWRQPDSIIRSLSHSVKWLVGLPITPWRAPDGARLQKYIEDNVVIKEEAKKATVTIKFDHSDPKFAVTFLSALHQTADNIVRKRALEKSTKYIDYLNAKISMVTVAEYRTALTDLLSDQEKTRMLASSSLPYAAELIDAPYASVQPTSPKGLLVLLGAILLGFGVGLTVVLVRLQLDASN